MVLLWRHRVVDRGTRAHVGLAKLGLGERRSRMGLCADAFEEAARWM